MVNKMNKARTVHQSNKAGSEQLTSIIILTYNQLAHTKNCLASIRQFTRPEEYEIIVVDNCSTDETVAWLKQQKDIRAIFNNENKGFPVGCNQGVKIARGSEILLLNNDTIVTPNWLNNLKRALYSDASIGAVGPVTNYATNYQAIQVAYKTAAELLQFAAQHNISDETKWEEKIKLVGFCMMIKRSVVEQIGLLDERFTPGHFEDDDYSFRILNAGYKLLLCQDTFIHHAGSVSFKEKPEAFRDTVNRNADKFKEKWGFNALYSTYCRHEIINMIDNIDKPDLTVLEVGCACGATLLRIKHLNKKAELHGIELCEGSAAIARNFAKVTAENIEKADIAYEEGMFDYIIFADVLEHLYDPGQVLTNMKKYLKPDGCILASIPNVQHISVVKDLLRGRWTYQDAGILDRTHVRFFTLQEINELFTQAGYSEIKNGAVGTNLSQDEKTALDQLADILSPQDQKALSAYQYLVKAKRAMPVIQSGEHRKRTFVAIFPETSDIHLKKDVGMIPYLMAKHHQYDACIVTYKKGEYPRLKQMDGLKLVFVKNTGDVIKDIADFIMRNAKNIDVLQLYGLAPYMNGTWVQLYKQLNPQGKVYIKLDANESIAGMKVPEGYWRILDTCTLISAETKAVCQWLNENWPVKVAYIPNGICYENTDAPIEYSAKRNVILTVGRLGIKAKATEILLEAFILAQKELLDWELRLVGPIDPAFKDYLQEFYKKNPTMQRRIIFTGEINDNELLMAEYRQAKIFCLPSRWESFGIVSIEAAKNGCYMVATDLPAARDVTNQGEYGSLFAVDDTEGLSRLLTEITKDEERMENTCQAIQKYNKEKFNWYYICQYIEQQLQSNK